MEWTFALRYLLARKSHSVINLIAAVSSIAAGIPVAAMVILMSVFNGFESLVKEMYQAVDADYTITFTDRNISEESFPSLIESLRAVEGVSSVCETIEGEAILSHAGHNTMCLLRGIDSLYYSVLPISRHICSGSLLNPNETGQILLGGAVAQDLGIYVPRTSTLQIFTMGGGGVGSLLPLSVLDTEEVTVQGIFRIDEQNDRRCAIIPKILARRLFGNAISSRSILLSLDNRKDNGSVKDEIRKIAGEEAQIVSRNEKNLLFYAVMRYEKWGLFLVSFLVLIIAALSSVGTIVILVMEKRHERQILASLGASAKMVKRIFIREGMAITGVGCVLGLIIGTAFVILQAKYSLIRMPEGAFIIDAYPVELRLKDTLLILFTVFITVWAVTQVAVNTILKKDHDRKNI